MFSSLASYLFGSNKTDTNCKATNETIETQSSGVEDIVCTDPEDSIQVTSLTPSVTGTTNQKSGKNRANNSRQRNKRKGLKKQQAVVNESTDQSTGISSCDETFDEDEWYIVGTEDKFDDLAPVEDLGEVIISVKPSPKEVSPVAHSRRLQHINSHSLYSGPRPQKQHNSLKKFRNTKNSNVKNGGRNNGLSLSTLSPSRIVNDVRNTSGPSAGLTADEGSVMTPLSAITQETLNGATNDNGIVENGTQKMDESWFVTPPPCFTSIGPINMETSPYENLLIEHPSMSVYHSIKKAEKAAAESIVKLDLGGVKAKKMEKLEKRERRSKENVQRKNSQTAQQRTSVAFPLDRQTVAQLKQELIMAHSVQKTQSKIERKDIRRSAINRANKARDVQSKNHTSRRADRQHSRIVSRANNNRKCCY